MEFLIEKCKSLLILFMKLNKHGNEHKRKRFSYNLINKKNVNGNYTIQLIFDLQADIDKINF